MDFKTAIAEDVDKVFFNDGEFAEIAIVDGRPVPIILDNDALNGKSELYALGLSEGEQLIFIKEKDMFRLPNIGEQITIKDKQWYVRHALSNEGVYEIRIGRKRAHN